jgi:hypothetical protein
VCFTQIVKDKEDCGESKIYVYKKTRRQGKNDLPFDAGVLHVYSSARSDIIILTFMEGRKVNPLNVANCFPGFCSQCHWCAFRVYFRYATNQSPFSSR